MVTISIGKEGCLPLRMADPTQFQGGKMFGWTISGIFKGCFLGRLWMKVTLSRISAWLWSYQRSEGGGKEGNWEQFLTLWWWWWWYQQWQFKVLYVFSLTPCLGTGVGEKHLLLFCLACCPSSHSLQTPFLPSFLPSFLPPSLFPIFPSPFLPFLPPSFRSVYWSLTLCQGRHRHREYNGKKKTSFQYSGSLMLERVNWNEVFSQPLIVLVFTLTTHTRYFSVPSTS
jgi:hypothetical protein